MIIVKNRQLTIPILERHIGTTYDDNAEQRCFLMDRVATNGVDLSNLSFRLDLEYGNGKKDTALLEKEVQEDAILLIWNIKNSVLQVPGPLFANMRATDSLGSVKWASFRATMYVEDTINTPGNYTGSLTELEQLEAHIDEKMEEMELRFDDRMEELDASEGNRENREAERQRNEEIRKRQEADRQKAEVDREERIEDAMERFEGKIREAKEAADLSESWAVGGTGTRPGEDGDNSKYYSKQSEAQAKRAEEAASLAETYAKIVPPKFHVDFDTMELIMDQAAKGMRFELDENKRLLFEYTS